MLTYDAGSSGLDAPYHAVWVCVPSAREVGVRQSEVHGHPRLHGEVEASLGYMESCLRKQLCLVGKQ